MLVYLQPTYLPLIYLAYKRMRIHPDLPDLPTCLPTCLPTYLHTSVHASIHPSIHHFCKHACMHACIHAYIQTYLYRRTESFYGVTL